MTGPPRRAVLRAPLLAAIAHRAPAADRADLLGDAAAALEQRHGGRLGFAVLDTAGGAPLSYRGGERFALCSTYKCLVAACVLARVDRGQERLDRRVPYDATALVAYSPVARLHVGSGMTVAALCEAAMTLSDNTAANLLLDCVGGPAGLTAWLRALGDGVTRLDRREPALNHVAAGDPRDTTTPLAMLADLRRLALGSPLSAASRARLVAWLTGCRTGAARLRGGVPSGWRVGDKTGGGPGNTTNDVAVFWPPGRAPIVVTAYYAGADASGAQRDAVLASLGHLAAAA